VDCYFLLTAALVLQIKEHLLPLMKLAYSTPPAEKRISNMTEDLNSHQLHHIYIRKFSKISSPLMLVVGLGKILLKVSSVRYSRYMAPVSERYGKILIWEMYLRYDTDTLLYTTL